MLVGAAVGAVVIGGGIVIYNNREAVGDDPTHVIWTQA